MSALRTAFGGLGAFRKPLLRLEFMTDLETCHTPDLMIPIWRVFALAIYLFFCFRCTIFSCSSIYYMTESKFELLSGAREAPSFSWVGDEAGLDLPVLGCICFLHHLS